VDLQDLTFDDVIFVNGKYYRPEKIIDAQVGAETVVTCQLITLNDQRPVWLDEPLNGFSVAVSNTNCIGEQGNIQITTEGTPAFTWELSEGGTQGNVNPTGSAPFTFSITAPVGIDTLTVTDSLGRVAIVQVNVPASTSTPVTSTFVVTDATGDCYNQPCNGSTLVSPSGGSGAPYTIDWLDNNNAYFNRTFMCAGTYQYVIYDSNGCPSDTYTVVVGCDDGLLYYQVEECGGGQVIVVSSTTTLLEDDVVSLNEIGGCYTVLSETQSTTAVATVDNTYQDCATCEAAQPTYISWKVQSCTQPYDPINHPNATRYVPLDPAIQGQPCLPAPSGQLAPGIVIADTIYTDEYGPCYEVIAQDSVETANMCYDQLHTDCTTCAMPTTFGYYAFACDTQSFPPTYFQSTTQLTVGGVYKIETGTYAGICVQIISAQETQSGEYLLPQQYTDCDDCQGITPPPAQVCHSATNTGLGNASVSWTFGVATYTQTIASGDTISFCAEIGSVVINSGQVGIYISDNPCISPKDCSLDLPTYVIESCIPAMGNWTLLRGQSNFQVGDVVQFRLNTGLAVYCGTIITLNNGNPDAILHNEDNSYDCEDSIHCLQ
jgi:hypothetical protein